MKFKKKQYVYAVGLALSITLAAALFVVPALVFEGTASSGTQIFGIDLSYKTAEDVETIVENKARNFLSQPTTFYIGNEKHGISLKDFDFEMDLDAALAKVEYTNFGENGLVSVIPNLKSNSITPYTNINETQLAQFIEKKIGAERYQNARITISEDGEVVVLEGEKGLRINKEKLTFDIRERLKTMDTNPVRVNSYIQSPEVTKEDIEKRMVDIKEKLNREILINYKKINAKIKMIEYVDWIYFEKDEEVNVGQLLGEKSPNIGIKIVLDRGKVREYIENNLSAGIEYPAQDVKTWQDEDEQVFFEGTVEDGLGIQKNKFVQMLELALNEDASKFEIPVKEIKGKVQIGEKLQELGVKELIGTGHTTFYGSPANRIHNIRTGIRKYNGLLIPPGESFSFNQNLGVVEAITGFLPELVIKPEGTLPEYGGGLCQVSTTLYRAALMAGLPIIEREPHSYAVSYYAQIMGHGLDATIYPGVHDVQFSNDTQGHILIQAYSYGMNAVYKLYGTNDGRKVQLEGPYVSNYLNAPSEPVIIETDELPPGEEKITEKPHTGFDAVWYRHLQKPDGSIVREPILSKYKAVPEKIMVGKPTENLEDENPADQSP
jgi:vancomycin resistance protein YoaR